MPSDPIAQSLEEGLHYFEEALPTIMDALDSVAKIHPFIGSESSTITSVLRDLESAPLISNTVAVCAFRAAYEFEKARRDNNKQCRALFLEMNNMMLVLLE